MKQIAIIGGGISGLACLHYLKKRYQDSAEITLYERNTDVGGSIATFYSQGFLFETGPNGFLTNQPNTLEFIEELGFSDHLIEANLDAQRRYIQIKGKLHLLPFDFAGFIKTPLLSTRQKLRFLQGFLIKNISQEQSVYDYVSTRFGSAVAERLVDPFLTGIYAGDIKRLHMKASFPKMSSPKGHSKAKLCSFKNGMGSLINHIFLKYQAHIKTGTEITNLEQIKADIIICATPAGAASSLLGMEVLNRVVYAPVAVAGLVIQKKSFKNVLDGFGYLVPSGEKKDILGVLLESNVFARQTREDQMFIRVMLGGAHHPGIARKTNQELINKAIEEIDKIYGLKEKPVASIVKVWAQGIPQYDLDYPALNKAIREELRRKSTLYLCANYLDGISFNDCINNSRHLVDSLL